MNRLELCILSYKKRRLPKSLQHNLLLCYTRRYVCPKIIKNMNSECLGSRVVSEFLFQTCLQFQNNTHKACHAVGLQLIRASIFQRGRRDGSVDKRKDSVLPEDWSSVLNTHTIGQLKVACNFSSRESDTIFRPSETPAIMCTYT